MRIRRNVCVCVIKQNDVVFASISSSILSSTGRFHRRYRIFARDKQRSTTLVYRQVEEVNICASRAVMHRQARRIIPYRVRRGLYLPDPASRMGFYDARTQSNDDALSGKQNIHVFQSDISFYVFVVSTLLFKFLSLFIGRLRFVVSFTKRGQ